MNVIKMREFYNKRTGVGPAGPERRDRFLLSIRTQRPAVWFSEDEGLSVSHLKEYTQVILNERLKLENMLRPSSNLSNSDIVEGGGRYE